MVTDLLSAAIRYAELGYAVFPCAPGGSVPITQHGFLDASTDLDVIRAWWARHSEANIGLATTGLLVIDIDGADNPWPSTPEQLAEMQDAPMSITPRGGSHHVFRQPDGVDLRCTTGVIAPKVDTRANGGYIVVPPSRRLQGPYHWIEGMELDIPREQLPLPPGWLIEALTPKEKQVVTVGDTIPDGQRNQTLFRLGCSARRNGASEAEILAYIAAVNANRCRPQLSDSELRQIAASAANKDVDQIATAVIEDHYSQIVAPAPDRSEYGDPGPTPEHLLTVPGFISDVMKYTLETAPYPERTLAFCGALALTSTLTGRTFCDGMDNRTNVYVLSLANSGTGKEHPRKVNARILEAVGESTRLGNSFASSEGIEDSLHLQPKGCMLFQVDEFDSLLLKISQGKEPRYESIAAMLLQLYGQANSTFTLRTRAGKDPMRVNQPHLTILGTAVPKYFYAALSERLMQNGLLGRMLVFETGLRGRGREATFCDVPDEIIDQAKHYLQAGESLGNMSNAIRPQVVKATDRAREAVAEYWAWYDDCYAEAEQAGDTVGTSIWARGFEKVRRLALIYSLSENSISPLIDSDAVRWAADLVAHQTRRALFMAGKHMVSSPFADRQKRLLELLEAWQKTNGDKWCPYHHITRKLRWTPREHDDLRNSLIEANLIEYMPSGNLGTKGRPVRLYRLAKKS